jgi:hypothetical protein
MVKRVVMKRALFALLVATFTLPELSAVAAEPDAVITRKALGCSKVETLLRIRELAETGHKKESQHLGLSSVSKGDCILLSGRTEVLRERFSDTDICVRLIDRTDCVWVSSRIIETRSGPKVSGRPSAKVRKDALEDGGSSRLY